MIYKEDRWRLTADDGSLVVCKDNQNSYHEVIRVKDGKVIVNPDNDNFVDEAMIAFGFDFLERAFKELKTRW